jgi:hypothetical protein
MSVVWPAPTRREEQAGQHPGWHSVEVLVALTHATLASAAILADEDDHGRR